MARAVPLIGILWPRPMGVGRAPWGIDGESERGFAMYRTTLKWMRESRLPYMADMAKTVGVDMTGWTFGQHFGSMYTLVDADMHRYGTWPTLSAAEQGTGDMIRAWQAVADARKAVR